MNLTNLDLDTLRTLVTANDLGGYGQAGLRLGRTPSAISLQMKRLQDEAGAVLFRKSGRALVLTEAGDIVLSYARRMLALNDELLGKVRGASFTGAVRLGFSQDFADTVVLSRFVGDYPQVRVEVRIEGNGALIEAMDKAEIDLALVIGFEDRPTAQYLGSLDVMWIAESGFHPPFDQPLPLIMLGPQCAFRKAAIQALDGSGHAWRLAATSPSLTGVWACAKGGLGVTLRSAFNLPQGLIHDKALFGLPQLGAFAVSLHTKRSAETNPITDRLHTLITEAVAENLAPNRRRLQKRS